MADKLDLVIIGAQKAGTTALKNYLGEHPDIITHPHTEFSYFSDEIEFLLDNDAMYKKYFGSNQREERKVIAKNVTLSYRENALKRLKAHSPDCLIVMVIREPVQRAFSAHQMALRTGWMSKPFSYAKEAIENNKAGKKDTFYRFMLDLGIYYKQIQEVQSHFPSNQITYFLYEDFKKNPLDICSKVFSLLGLDDTYRPNTTKKHNVGGEPKSKIISNLIRAMRRPNNPLKAMLKNILPEKYFVSISQKINALNKKTSKKKEIDSNTKMLLKSFYKPLNQKCSELINLDLNSYWQY